MPDDSTNPTMNDPGQGPSENEPAAAAPADEAVAAEVAAEVAAAEVADAATADAPAPDAAAVSGAAQAQGQPTSWYRRRWAVVTGVAAAAAVLFLGGLAVGTAIGGGSAGEQRLPGVSRGDDREGGPGWGHGAPGWGDNAPHRGAPPGWDGDGHGFGPRRGWDRDGDRSERWDRGDRSRTPGATPTPAPSSSAQSQSM